MRCFAADSIIASKTFNLARAVDAGFDRRPCAMCGPRLGRVDRRRRGAAFPRQKAGAAPTLRAAARDIEAWRRPKAVQMLARDRPRTDQRDPDWRHYLRQKLKRAVRILRC